MAVGLFVEVGLTLEVDVGIGFFTLTVPDYGLFCSTQSSSESISLSAEGMFSEPDILSSQFQISLNLQSNQKLN